MDRYVRKNEMTHDKCQLKNNKTEENAQKTTFRQNNNTPLTQASFIPIYTKKTDMCHKPADEKNQRRAFDVPSNSFHASPPMKQQKDCNGHSDKSPRKPWVTHLRRQSVGFEDVAALSSNYGSHFSKTRKQSGTINSNTEAETISTQNYLLTSENERNFIYGTESRKESISAINQNSEVMTENANESVTAGKHHLKDKSSKRKSSLNRLDFIDFSAHSAGNNGMQSGGGRQSKNNSSSDEGNDAKSIPLKSEFLSSKRKHFSSSANHRLAAHIVSRQPSLSEREKVLPRSLQQRGKLRQQHKRVQSLASHHLQKLSHSAGELENLTDPDLPSAAPHKICLSAQEFDPPDSLCRTDQHRTEMSSPSVIKGLVSPEHLKSLSGNASQSNFGHQGFDFYNTFNSDTHGIARLPISLPHSELNVEQEGKNPMPPCLDFHGTLDMKHIDSKSEEDDAALTVDRMEQLDLGDDREIENEMYISADDASDFLGSDSERRPNSILRRKSSGRKELHGILKPPPDDKSSKTPPSILKHRESSEEKEMWQQSDLHSILKKSTSEDESCNSGPDIRPILKVSTDDESPHGGGGGMRPRPILKKRTSFSEECTYVSYPNGELKPILKKKSSSVALEEQPRPILKSRRKSEDAKSSMSEFVASRPRAYSADMGVKPNLEGRFNGASNSGGGEDCNKEETQQQDS